MQPRTLVITPPALAELEEILDYLTAAEPVRGRSYVDRRMAHFQAHARAGLTGSRTDHIAPNTQSFVYRNHIALITVTPTTIVVHHVFHAARKIQAIPTLEEHPS